MSRLAAATTIPVTNNAIQENSRKSLTTLPMIAPVLQQAPSKRKRSLATAAFLRATLRREAR